MSAHPRDILLGAQARTGQLPVCDHYSGVEARMRKSLQLQAEMTQEFGACVFDVTLDCEDGAPVGGEAEHAALVTELALAPRPRAGRGARAPGRPSGLRKRHRTIAGKAGRACAHHAAQGGIRRRRRTRRRRWMPPARRSCRCRA
jgi:citrate lyase subunit beta/citryl-CoA lyase